MDRLRKNFPFPCKVCHMSQLYNLSFLGIVYSYSYFYHNFKSMVMKAERDLTFDVFSHGQDY